MNEQKYISADRITMLQEATMRYSEELGTDIGCYIINTDSTDGEVVFRLKAYINSGDPAKTHEITQFIGTLGTALHRLNFHHYHIHYNADCYDVADSDDVEKILIPALRDSLYAEILIWFQEGECTMNDKGEYEPVREKIERK